MTRTDYGNDHDHYLGSEEDPAGHEAVEQCYTHAQHHMLEGVEGVVFLSSDEESIGGRLMQCKQIRDSNRGL